MWRGASPEPVSDGWSTCRPDVGTVTTKAPDAGVSISSGWRGNRLWGKVREPVQMLKNCPVSNTCSFSRSCRRWSQTHPNRLSMIPSRLCRCRLRLHHKRPVCGVTLRVEVSSNISTKRGTWFVSCWDYPNLCFCIRRFFSRILCVAFPRSPRTCGGFCSRKP